MRSAVDAVWDKPIFSRIACDARRLVFSSLDAKPDLPAREAWFAGETVAGCEIGMTVGGDTVRWAAAAAAVGDESVGLRDDIRRSSLRVRTRVRVREGCYCAPLKNRL